MDFMRLLKSIEELLYELVTWILFYPLTLWRCLWHPLKMMSYAETELKGAEDEQFDDTLSPPIFLLITLFVANLIGQRFGVASQVAMPEVLADERNLLLFRAIAFSVFPLLMALQGVRQKKARLSRQMLKPAFYSQCFTAAPFIFVVDLALIIGRHGGVVAITAGVSLFVAGLAWYLNAETRWFLERGDISGPRALLLAVLTTASGFAGLLAVTVATAFAFSMLS